MIFNIITRLIIINIAPITELFCNWPLICNCLLLKVCVRLVRLTSNRMFGSGDFWDKSSSWFLKILKLPSFHSSNFKFFKNALGQFIQNCPPKHVITSTTLLKMLSGTNNDCYLIFHDFVKRHSKCVTSKWYQYVPPYWKWRKRIQPTTFF